MQPLTPPPPYVPKQTTKPSSLYQIVLTRQATNQQRSSTPERLVQTSKLGLREKPILREPKKTNPLIWFGAVICLLLSLLIILLGIATLVILVGIKPTYPVFDTPAASLRVVYFDSAEFLNGDLTLLANFSNPNKKLSVEFEYLYVELYFRESLVSRQILQPFDQRPGEVRAVPVRFLSSLVHLQLNVALELQKQVLRNLVEYNLKGTFKVRVKYGQIHYTYWLHGNCLLEMTSPPIGVLIAHRCKFKR